MAGRYANRETAAGVFARPSPPPRPVVRPPAPAPTPVEAAAPGAPLAVRPLRTPAPPVTAIRVQPVPVDGFEFETAAPWTADPPPPPPEPPPVVVPPPPPRGRRRWVPPGERPTITWLDE